MSDLYLVLRSRLPDVTDWVELGVQTMREARKRQGLSYESIARLYPVAAKTYERWEKAGRVPRDQLSRTAEILDLEIEQPVLERIRVSAKPADRDEISRLADEVASVRQMVERLLRLAGPDSDGEEPPQAATG